jgi:transcriptional regulator GlxA family with amidase domain
MAAKTIGIIIFDDVLTSEVIAPAEVFGIASHQEWFKDAKVLMIGVEPKPTIRTAEGITIAVDCTIADDMSLDVLIVPGAMEMDTLLNNEKLNDFIRAHEVKSEWVSSNCSGAFLLAHSGVLDGKQATTWFGGETSLQEQYPLIQVVVDKPVVMDNRRVTSNGGLVSYQAALVLLAKLTSVKHAKVVYDTLSIGRLESWSAIEESLAVATP